MKGAVTIIEWEEPWRAVQSDTETLYVQGQLEREISVQHLLYGKGAQVIGRRIDNDDVVAVLSDGTYVNVHLVWTLDGNLNAFPNQYPSWFPYGILEHFLEAMHADANKYHGKA